MLNFTEHLFFRSINVQAVCDHEGNYFDYKTLFVAFFFSVLSVRTFVYVDYLPLIFSVCQFDPIPIRPIDDTILSIEM